MAKIQHLQGIRGVAILSVVLFHFFPKKFRNGYLGVDIFFLLSGYLMTQMMEKIEQFSVKNISEFLYRRWKRIVPLYYTVTLVILVLLPLGSMSIQKTNVDSGLIAVLFSTNLIQPDGVEGYFAKLGVAIDLFTHTWSLALEMQFYFLFPFIYLLYRLVPLRFYFICLIVSLSGLFYSLSDSFISFNSVFSRIWQFLVGMLVFLLAKPETKEMIIEEDQTEQLLPTTLEPIYSPSNELRNLAYVCLLSIVLIILCPEELHSDFARANMVLLTAAVLLYGNSCPLLENRQLVYVGEVSYAWYLIHWPIVALYRLNQRNCNGGLYIGMALSFLLAVLLHEFFEKRYLTWKKSIISIISLTLLFSNLTVIIMIYKSIPVEKNNELNIRAGSVKRIMTKYNYPSDFLDDLVLGYENRTDCEAFLNKLMLQSMKNFCPKFKKTKNPREARCELNSVCFIVLDQNTQGTNPSANLKLLVIGNSWAGNIFKVMHDECKAHVSHLEISFTGGCEALTQSNNNSFYDCSYDYMYLDAVREVKPDVLFIIDRHFQLMNINKGQNPFDDNYFKIAVQRLEDIEKLVSKRIYILDAFPDVKWGIMRTLRDKMQSNVTIYDQQRTIIDASLLVAKLRVQRIVQQCSKCKSFDYVSQFFFDGIFKIYDPKYFVSFFTDGGHLTPPGWERVRPLIRHLCENL